MNIEKIYNLNSTNDKESYDDKTLHNMSMSECEEKDRIYNSWAKSYDAYVQKHEYLGPKILVKNAWMFLSTASDELRILDFGCGTGLVGKEINSVSKEGYSLTGIDISEGMIQKSRDLNVYRKLVCNNIVDTNKSINDVRNIVGNEFDLVISCGVFLEGHVSLDVVFRVLIKLLKPGGGILAITIRDSFLKKTPHFEGDLNAIDGYKVERLCEIDYLKGVKAWMLIISRK